MFTVEKKNKKTETSEFYPLTSDSFLEKLDPILDLISVWLLDAAHYTTQYYHKSALFL